MSHQKYDCSRLCVSTLLVVLLCSSFSSKGGILCPFFPAKQGWSVSAFDISAEGRKKALRLAKDNQVSIDYQVGELTELDFSNNPFDAIALIYAHFPSEVKSKYHKLMDSYLRKGGTIIFEAFGKNHLEYRSKNPYVGGPKNLDSLFSIEEIRGDFKDYEVLVLEEREVELNEGKYHSGTGSVVRFAGRKRY
ncbi:class I SAM-dependent methyltransferase [Flagellimonas abyssi]|uniref:Class I SAM-dependent methyltransferase n=1 Tax=Flagellimonas abyssi TaxID=2864871 RepID=A0ABS7EW18_9FLAO|nr:class I SAM-dependent methyltransferase [Allomuricauda abyssi]MBW8201725.1 class I SAM-dependent methyltransferase [Allomuricauda abyssi]